MNVLLLTLALAVTNVDLDVVPVPFSGAVRLTMSMGARGELRREGSVTRVRIEVDRIAAPAALNPAFNTYCVWAISAEGFLDNLGELEIRGNKAQFSATTRLNEFGVLITAEPHYMVDAPSAAVAYRSENPDAALRRKTVQVPAGSVDYSTLKTAAAPAAFNSVAQARTAFQIAEAAGAASLAPEAFRNAQLAIGSVDELVNRAATAEMIWPSVNEAIRLSHQAAVMARAKR